MTQGWDMKVPANLRQRREMMPSPLPSADLLPVQILEGAGGEGTPGPPPSSGLKELLLMPLRTTVEAPRVPPPCQVTLKGSLKLF